MSLLLGIDLGTSYLKAGVFDFTGKLRGLGRVATGVREPRPGWKELEARELLEHLREAVTAALLESGCAASEVAAISYGSQANTFLLLDERNRPITPLIFWHDRRAESLAGELRDFGSSETRRRRTGLWDLVPESAPAKLLWIARHSPEVWQQCRSVMTVSDYLTFFLTGERVGDASTASLTGLYDLTKGEWWSDALGRFGLAPSQLSVPLQPGAVAGRLTSEAAAFFQLGAGTKVAAGALDHHAAAMGSGLGAQVEASLSSGTVLAAMVLGSEILPMPDCIWGPHPGELKHYALAYDPGGAGRLEDYQKRFAPEVTVGELLGCLESGEGRLHETHGEALRGHLRDIAQTERSLLEKISPGKRFSRIAATGGGARGLVSLQIKADVLGVPVMSTSPEPACLGAAVLASVGSGVHENLECAIVRMIHSERVAYPNGVGA
ncbi:MAG: FGGY-family carbohydrate kinase [Opitutaceae bacterium]|nr:FGGY-family carbohydrate kinase [Opitutaceae bacterium]